MCPPTNGDAKQKGNVSDEEEIDNAVQGKGSSSIPEYNHLLADMWRHASAKGLSVYSFLTSIPHHPVAQATSDFHPPTVVPNIHLSIPWLLSKCILVAVHACLSSGARADLGSASRFVLYSSFRSKEEGEPKS